MPNKYGEKDWLDTALPLLNSLEIVDFDADGEVLYYALIEDTKDNREVLKQAGVTDKEIQDSLGHFKSEGAIDLTAFIWKFANWFNGKEFVREKPFDDM
ncbi:hypothetical protein E2L07_19265 [Halalkalibacterium halodurans]|uniref:hypothetical protein n=1 Tax=Halalkalibacterium halodurans TaxID=86665 RepID=UPI00106882DF|nr:hypothetical protein [Halalkalibacterium halodurans]TES47184.1 hypothetical protein E2L07_19265 [Halalkalibacterium halodurans]